ncbi:MAG: transporter substrate-binding domain-containing protein [Candidatus Ancillula sp.]|jgi:polar amino acid transport system substrate-binding protein|nr:transporter substrate-binding domain-containing protein [Candidatus Ancillula sp.]
MKKLLAIVLVLVSGVSLTSCGNKNSSSEVYKIAAESTFAPFAFQDSGGKYVGIDVDIFDAIAKAEGFKYEMSHPGFEAAKNNTLSMQSDGCMCSMSVTEDRKAVFDFSETYYDSEITIGVKKDQDQVKSFADLRGKKIATKLGTVSETWLNSHKAEYGYEIKTFDTGDLSYSALKIGSVDAIMDDEAVVNYAIKQGVDLKIPFQGFKSGALAFAVKKGQNAQLLEKFNRGLEKLKSSGEFDKIVKKYVQE